MISIELIDVKKPRFFKSRNIRSFIKKLVLNEQKKMGDLSFVFCSDEYLLRINQEYLQHDYYTDIITFDYCQGEVVSGDLMISLDRVSDNSKMLGTSHEEEFYRVVFHGVLHLCGYKDKSPSDIREMRSKEENYLNQFVSRETNDGVI